MFTSFSSSSESSVTSPYRPWRAGSYRQVAVDKTLTASPGGQWMLLALGADGYRALTKPTKYECYSTLNTDGDVEISPTQYETFVARVLEYSNTAQQAAASAKTNAETAATAATRAVNAKGQAETAARTATAGNVAGRAGRLIKS